MSSALDRFFAKIAMPSGFGACWNWTAAKHSAGYGAFSFAGKTVYAHRFSYEQAIGEIPPELELDHLCRNRSCVNPIHLEAVTRRVNQHRGESPPGRNASKTSCPAGHAYDAGYSRPHKRRCRTCTLEQNRRSQQKKAAQQ